MVANWVWANQEQNGCLPFRITLLSSWLTELTCQ